MNLKTVEITVLAVLVLVVRAAGNNKDSLYTFILSEPSLAITLTLTSSI